MIMMLGINGGLRGLLLTVPARENNARGHKNFYKLIEMRDSPPKSLI